MARYYRILRCPPEQPSRAGASQCVCATESPFGMGWDAGAFLKADFPVLKARVPVSWSWVGPGVYILYRSPWGPC